VLSYIGECLTGVMTSRVPIPGHTVASVTEKLQDQLEAIEWSLQQAKELKKLAVCCFHIVFMFITQGVGLSIS